MTERKIAIARDQSGRLCLCEVPEERCAWEDDHVLVNNQGKMEVYRLEMEPLLLEEDKAALYMELASQTRLPMAEAAVYIEPYEKEKQP